MKVRESQPILLDNKMMLGSNKKLKLKITTQNRQKL